MPELPQFGKVTRDYFESVIYPNLGAKRTEVVVGPAIGVDNCVVRISSNEVLVSSTDPLSFIPELGPEDSAWLSIHLVASDVATSGFNPQYAIVDLNLPPSLKASDFERYWKALSVECAHLGIAIIGGHTGRFEGLESTIIGSGVVFSIGSSKRYITSAGGKLGDKLILTKGAAIASTGILARVFEQRVREKLGGALTDRAIGYFGKISVVNDALTAARAGRGFVSAMHDATEGGVLSALYELAKASGLGALVEKQRILVSEETKGICNLFGIDPYTSLSEGSLVVSCEAAKANSVIASLEQSGVRCSIVGELLDEDQGIRVRELDETESPIKYPTPDPYWSAYYEAKQHAST